MQDQPLPAELLVAVTALLRETIMPQLAPELAFQVRVAANALDLVQREMTSAGPAVEEEHLRLRTLLGMDGSLAALNAELCERIRSGACDASTPELAAHLWATTLEKLAVDQPTYASYRRILAGRKQL